MTASPVPRPELAIEPGTTFTATFRPASRWSPSVQVHAGVRGKWRAAWAVSEGACRGQLACIPVGDFARGLAWAPSDELVNRSASATTHFGRHPNDGEEYDAQCARCGSTIAFVDCPACGGHGTVEAIDLDDEVVDCGLCGGNATFPLCISTEKFCQDNPLPGRAAYARSNPEWFRVSR
jgi:hypothetical protein